MDEKDRFGDKLRDVEHGREDEYFARRDRELLERLRSSKQGETDAALREMARQRCPKCGERLQAKALSGVTVDECPACQGMWLDRGELEEIAKRDQKGWLVRWLGGEREA